MEAKNALENYAYSMRNTLREGKLQLDPSDKSKMEGAINEAITWLDANQLAEVEEFEHKQKELEELCSPIIAKAYQGGAAGAGAGHGEPAAGSAHTAGGPQVEEVD